MDTIQDMGRMGSQHLGINVSGAMDTYSLQLANALLGKDLGAATIEMHFPAAEIRFDHSTIFCLTGGDFSPMLDQISVPLNKPVLAQRGNILRFSKIRSGARCYLSVMHNLRIDRWMKSYSTNLKAEAGGYEGRRLRAGDRLDFVAPHAFDIVLTSNYSGALGWQAGELPRRVDNRFKILRGNEWCWLSASSIKSVLEGRFLITHQADRMGYRLMGPKLQQEGEQQLVSSGVKCGTIQMLPGGQLIVLMADSHTTGGYPRIAHIISTDIAALAQLPPRNFIRFALSDIDSAERSLVERQQFLEQLARSSRIKIERFLHVYN